MKDHRSEPRVIESVPIAVTVLSSPKLPEIEHRTFPCATHDLSVRGLNFALHSALPIGAVIHVEVALTAPADTFRHRGRVVWTHHTQKDIVLSYRSGIRITETLDHRTADWAEAVERRLRADTD